MVDSIGAGGVDDAEFFSFNVFFVAILEASDDVIDIGVNS